MSLYNLIMSKDSEYERERRRRREREEEDRRRRDTETVIYTPILEESVTWQSMKLL